MSATDLDSEANARADAQALDPWHFPDGAPVQIVCGALDAGERGKYSEESDHNYMALCSYADQDALVELVRHVSAVNPGVRVSHSLPTGLGREAEDSHVVILGNMGWKQLAGSFAQVTTQVWQVDGDLDGEVFETVDGERFPPNFDTGDPTGKVVEDVGFFWRGPNPANSERTVSICSGVFTRGVFGAVRALTDPDARQANADYLRKRFADTSAYGLLMRVAVDGPATSTPSLSDGKDRLKEFPPS